LEKNKDYEAAKKLAIIYSIILSVFTCLKHEAFLTFAYDLGIFMQAFWTTIHAGKFFFETPDLGISEKGSFFGVHFSPIMFLILILYYLFPYAYTLLIFQSFLLGLAAIPLYKLAKEITKKHEIALAFSIIYLIYPPIIAANLYDFHLESFFPIVFFSAFFYLEKEQFNKFYLTLIFALTILDFASIALVFSTFFYASFIKYGKNILRVKTITPKIRNHIFNSIVFMTLITIYFEVVVKIISVFGTTPFSKTPNWPDLGSNIYEIILGLLNPYKVIKALSYDIQTKLIWILVVTFPLLFLPFFAPLELIPSLPWIVVIFLSRYPPYYQLRYQYGALYAPFLLFAAIKGYKNITEVSSTRLPARKAFFVGKKLYRKLSKKEMVKLATIASIISTILGLFTLPKPIPFSEVTYTYILPVPNRHTYYLRKILSYVPDNASILAQDNIFPHVAHRVHAFVWIPPNLTYMVDYAIGDVSRPEFYMFIPNKNFRYSDIFQALINSGKYGVYASTDGIILLKKNYNGTPVLYVPIEKTYSYKNIKHYKGCLSKVENSTNKYVLTFKNPKNNSILWYGLYVALSPGKYNLFFKIKIIGENSINSYGPVLTLNIHACIKGITILNKTVKILETENGKWIGITLTLNITYPDIFDFRGVGTGAAVTICLDYIKLKQIEVYP